jgi:toxin ParE1/3/4
MPAFHLTRRAARDLQEIYNYSLSVWGENTATHYINDIYSAFHTIDENPHAGHSYRHRAAPFMILAIRQHFIIYDVLAKGVVILSIIHQVRDIEKIIAAMEASFISEIESLRNGKS